MGVIRNVTEGIYPLLSYQQALLDKVSGGFKAGEMMIISAGRRTSKSYLNQLYNTNLCKEILLPMNPEPKYKFSRAKWYEFEVPYPINSAIFDWCEEQFGPEPTKPDAWSRWSYAWRIIKFRDEKDYAWFMLRWG